MEIRKSMWDLARLFRNFRYYHVARRESLAINFD